MAFTPPSLTSPSVPAKIANSGRFTAGIGIAVVLALSWAYVAAMDWGMVNMDVSEDWLLMPNMMDWSRMDLVLVFVMWAIMMVAMMLPSAAPMLMLFSKISYGRTSAGHALIATAALTAGYLAVWTVFSLVVTLIQWRLLEARLVSPMMTSASPAFSAVLLVTAGAYQFTSLKNACLSRCRSPWNTLLNHWHDGPAGAFVMGLRQGGYCVGCCWLLMALLFVFGVMNLLWIAALSFFVLLEKLLREPRWFAQGTGAMLLAWGALVATRAASVA